MVGPAGFEPTTFRPPDGRATKLRYGPKKTLKENLFLTKIIFIRRIINKFIIKTKIKILTKPF